MSGIFASRKTNTTAAATKADDVVERKNSEFWMNIGYSVPGTDDAGNPTSTFVALNRGIPLDDIENLDESRSGNIGFLNQAANALLADIRKGVADLKPGESMIIAGTADTLEVQVRRVRDKSVTADAGNNPFLRKA